MCEVYKIKGKFPPDLSDCIKNIPAFPVGVRRMMSHGVTALGLLTQAPVSYTHLDVYKRQPLMGGPVIKF